LKFLLQEPTTETNDLIDKAIAAFDVLITKVNAKNVENKKKHISNKSIGTNCKSIDC
jgi:hypothetical protein